ncbi:MAG TPA: NUDIX hydrolase [Burkholderiaceae bacterium]|nr:NUDIX hydrolase [Burkholderiaceae bacterium]
MLLQSRRIKHCRTCGTLVEYRIPSDDNRERAVCSECGTVHYENPLNVVGTLPVWGDRVLLCKRNIEPRFGKWTLPAGFMELGETTEAGALRETDEEAGAQVELQGLFTMLNVVQIGQVHFFYRARLLSTDFTLGFETSEARLFLEDEVPWEQLAFRTVRETLHRYFEDRRRGSFGMHFADIV